MNQSVLDFTVDSSLAAIGPAVERLLEFCGAAVSAAAAAEPSCVGQQLQLSVTEALTNIVKHAYGETMTGEIRIRVECRPDRITVTLFDHGRAMPSGIETLGMVPGDVVDGAALPDRGMGLFMMRSDMDRLDYQSQGGVNRLVLTKSLRPAACQDNGVKH